MRRASLQATHIAALLLVSLGLGAPSAGAAGPPGAEAREGFRLSAASAAKAGLHPRPPQGPAPKASVASKAKHPLFTALMPGVLEGKLNTYIVKKGDTLPLIASRFGTSPECVWKQVPESTHSSLKVGHPVLVDQRNVIPRFHSNVDGLVLNVPGAHVYLVKHGRVLRDYEVGVSRSDWRMPLGVTKVREKQKNPTWYIPKKIQAERRKQGLAPKDHVPPGPLNPLGPRYISVWDGTYGFHGTTDPTSIGRYVSHGCIRFLKSDIVQVFDLVKVGTPVHVFYQPVLLAKQGAKIWLSAFPDIYERHYDYLGAAHALARQAGAYAALDDRAVKEALRLRDGLPRDVARKHPKSPPPKSKAPQGSGAAAQPSAGSPKGLPGPVVLPSAAPRTLPGPVVLPSAPPAGASQTRV